MTRLATNLHMHSKFSDGMLWPEELVARGQALGLQRMALTDHDSMEGVERFLAACAGSGIRGVAAVEVDCVAPEIDYDSELLGYFPDGRYARTRALCEGRRQEREAVVQRFLRNAEELHDLELPWAEFRRRKLGQDEPLGAPYKLSFNKVDVWMFLLETGVLPPGTRYRDFKRSSVLAGEQPNNKPHLIRIVESIRADGGLPVLPHPGHIYGDDLQRIREDLAGLERMLAFFADAGVWGLEIYYYGTPHDDQINQLMRQQAARHGLALTAGSDCHGPGSRKDSMEAYLPRVELSW